MRDGSRHFRDRGDFSVVGDIMAEGIMKNAWLTITPWIRDVVDKLYFLMHSVPEYGLPLIVDTPSWRAVSANEKPLFH